MFYGHATDMNVHPTFNRPTIRPNDGLVLIWMIQHAGFPGDGNSAHPTFKNWAVKRFGK